MLFWKKVEIYCGFSFKEFTELRKALKAKGIRYDFRIMNSNASSGHQNESSDTNDKNLYYLYIHSKDYYQAMHTTSNRNV